MEERIEQLIAQMTLDEKVSLVSGADFWTTPAIERLNIPQFKVTDGPNGARGGDFSGSVSAACFPVGIALAATWNLELIEQIGVALAEETKSKGAHVLLGPTVNIHRSPLNGRNFECYSEDPYLSARLAVAYINGVQSQNIGTSIKHFICNDSEFERNSISSEVGERALREIYLPPFKAAVNEANTWAIMSAYNKLNGTFCAENPYILQDILKEEWGFDGFVVSDWFGTKSTVESAKFGLDLEMPGPAVWWGDKLVEAVESGEVEETAVDDKVHRILRIMARTGALDSDGLQPEQAIDNPAHRQLIREAASEGIVLLKNEGSLLPINKEKQQIAIIGPNVMDAKIMGGGSAQVAAHYVVTPFEGVRTKAGDQHELRYHIGTPSFKMMPILPLNGDGLTVTYFNSNDFSGPTSATEQSHLARRMWMDNLPDGVSSDTFSARLETTFTAKENGRHSFGIVSAGLSRLYVNDELLIENWENWEAGDAFFGTGSLEATGQIAMEAGKTYHLRIEFAKHAARLGIAALQIGHMPPVEDDPIAAAAKLASEADVALLFIGTGGEWESEGHDRADMELPAEQVELLHAVVEANPNTVVVLNTGSPITMDWLDKVPAVVQAWFSGQESGNAIADVLFGDVNPSGRLTQTFPVRLQDNPAFLNYPGENGRVHYGEGIFVGYRYYEKKEIAPRFPFGFGLSYTTFGLSNLQLSKTESDSPELNVSVDITNTGGGAGKEVVQLYVRDVASRLIRPLKELKGFQKVHLEPNETKTVNFTLAHDAFAYFDDGRSGWLAEAGEYVIGVGHSSQNVPLHASFTLKSDQFISVKKAATERNFSTQTLLKELFADDEAQAILVKHLPNMMDSPQLQMAMGMSLLQISGFAKDVFTDELMGVLDEELQTLGTGIK